MPELSTDDPADEHGEELDDELDSDDDWGDDWDDDDEFADWEEVDVDDGTTLLLPAEDAWDFRDHVEVIAGSSGGVSSAWGPMTHEHREYVCCFEGVYFLRYEGDSGSSNTFLGAGASVRDCVEQSASFVVGRSGEPVGAWSDEDADGDIDDEELWDPDDDDPDDDDGLPEPIHPRVMSCRRVPRASRSARPPVRPRSTQNERREWLEQLWATTIIFDGVVIAGVRAADELPANTTWFVIPCDEGERAQLERVLGQVQRVVVEVDGRRLEAAFTDRMAATTAARVGEAFGADEVWQLDRDSIRTISTVGPVVVARALRVR